MKRIFWLLAGSLTVAILCIQQYYLVRLKAQNLALLERVASLSATIEQPDAKQPPLESLSSAELSEVLRLRNEVSMLRRQTNDLAQQSGANRAAADAAPAVPPIPAGAWTFSGYATPEAAVQSTAWAMLTGNLQAFLQAFSPEARNEVAERFTGKSQSEIHSMLLAEIGAAKALRLDRKFFLDDGTVGFPISSVVVDDGLNVNKKEKILRFANVSGEWKFAR